MRKNFILDTNVLLHNPLALFSFPGNNLLIPIEVIEEIDVFKRDVTELGRNSRTVAQMLDGLRGRGRLGEGISLDNQGMLRIVCEEIHADLRSSGFRVGNRVDNRILSLAVHLQEQYPEETTIVVTKNVNLRLKADALGIPAEDYETDQSPDADVYTGWYEKDVSPEIVTTLEQGRTVKIDDMPNALPNEYILLRDSSSEKHNAMGRFKDPAKGLIQPLRNAQEPVVGISPLNLEQTFALDALMDDSIQLITLTGKAGTGKTLLAVAAGLHKVFKEDRYNRLLIFRPTTPVGKDIGFLPGDISEKMRPWMQPVYDALELIREQDRRSRHRTLPPDIMECEEISIEPLTYIRGRSIPHQFIMALRDSLWVIFVLSVPDFLWLHGLRGGANHAVNSARAFVSCWRSRSN